MRSGSRAAIYSTPSISPPAAFQARNPPGTWAMLRTPFSSLYTSEVPPWDGEEVLEPVNVRFSHEELERMGVKVHLRTSHYVVAGRAGVFQPAADAPAR